LKKIEIKELTESDIDFALLKMKKRAMEKISKKKSSQYPFVSLSEAVGKLTEEYGEACEEAHLQDVLCFESEILDVSFVCIRAIVAKKEKLL